MTGSLSIDLLALLLIVAGCAGGTAARPAVKSAYLAVDVVGTKQEFPVDSQGRLKASINVSSPDGSMRLAAAENTAVTDRDFRPIRAVQVAVNASPPPPPADAVMVGTAYTLLPQGATFNPWVTLTLGYSPRALPPGVTQDSLYVAFHDGRAWQASLYRRVDFAATTVTAQLDRSATIAIMAGKTPVSPGPSTPVVGAMKGNLASDFTLQSLDGKTVSLSGLRGKPVMLNFWTTWCTYCVIEMPLLEQVYQKWSEKGLVLLAIDVNESEQQVRSAIQDKKFTFTVLLDSRGDTAVRYRVAAFPTTFFIDGGGVIRDIRVGAFPNRSVIESSLSRIMP